VAPAYVKTLAKGLKRVAHIIPGMPHAPIASMPIPPISTWGKGGASGSALSAIHHFGGDQQAAIEPPSCRAAGTNLGGIENPSGGSGLSYSPVRALNPFAAEAQRFRPPQTTPLAPALSRLARGSREGAPGRSGAPVR